MAHDPSINKQLTARLLASERLVDRCRGAVKTKIPLAALLLLFGCSTQSPSGNEGDGGNLADGGIDGGVDGGIPDGGVDAGVPCTSANTIVEVPLECRSHIPETETAQYLYNPPVSGEHYPVWAMWQKYTTTVPRGYWVHNLEHGGVIFLYRPDAPQSVKDALNRVYDAIPLEQDCVDEGLPHNRAILTPDPLLDVPWAVTVSGPELRDCTNGGPPEGVGYQIKSDCVASEQALVNFAVTYRDHSIEMICDQGGYPYPP